MLPLMGILEDNPMITKVHSCFFASLFCFFVSVGGVSLFLSRCVYVSLGHLVCIGSLQVCIVYFVLAACILHVVVY
jgi:hypothetical protein